MCRSSLKTVVLPFTGFCAFMALVQLYESHLLLSDVSVFNYSLYGSLAQLVTLGVLAILGAEREWVPGKSLVQLSSIAGAVGMAAQLLFIGQTAGIFGALAVGVALAVLAVAWGPRLGTREPRSIFLFVLGSLLVSTALCFFCFAAPAPFSVACAIMLPLASAVLYVADAATSQPSTPTRESIRISQAKPAFNPRSLPWPFLVILGACCLLNALFIGMTLNPYCFQSASVSRYMYLFALVSLGVLFAGALAVKQPKAHVFFIAPLALLLVGLLLFSTGLLGSIIMPLGLILAAKSCCLALC